MAIIQLYETPTTYSKAGGDEWDEVYESFIYLYDDRKRQIIKKKIYGRDNDRNPSMNYEREAPIIIEEKDLPTEALIVLKEYKNQKMT